jgi:tetratricopeptide (TPR) repeat protein
MATGIVLELRGEHQQALELYREVFDDDPTGTSTLVDIGRCQRELGEHDAAEESLRQRLTSSPYDPKAHYELALVYEARGDVATAIQHLETALEVWAEADPQYEPAAEAREKLAELTASE